MASKARREAIRDIRQTYSWFYPLILGVVLLGVGVWIGASLFADKDGYAMNVVTEGFGVAVSVLITLGIIDKRNVKRESKRRHDEIIKDLVQRAGSPVNQTAKSAMDQLSRLDKL
ncbi:MAG: hypothetical protein OXG68_16835 [Chloroflexi bacterium]|nr:hypothetical protein [Chloroflexota bacterium]